MRSQLSENWVSNLEKVVKALNATPNSALNGLTPDSIHSNLDDPKVDQALGGIVQLPGAKRN